MSRTSSSLLERLRGQPDEADWRRLVAMYSPLIQHWLRRQGLPEQESNDLLQEVLAVVVRRIPDFEHNERTGAFRNWLRTITVNCWRDFWKRRRKTPTAGGGSDFQNIIVELEDPDSNLSQIWNKEHDLHVMRHMLEEIRSDFEEKTWRAFQSVVLDGKSAGQTAADLDLTTNAVFIAKSRVLARLRQEAEGLLE